LKRVIAKEKYAARLKYLKVDYVPITEDGYWERAEELLKYIRELVELENGIDFTHDKSVAIVLTDKEAESFLKNEKRLSVCKTLYRGHNVMFPAKMNAVLSERGIAVKTIPDYYYPELED
jgi:adenine-specific DNA-methyltransferase